MPVTIKSGLMKYKKPTTGAYVGINAVSDNRTADQIAAIDTAGAAQVSAVEQKGAEVIEEIPSSYTEIVEEVTEVKNALSEKLSKPDVTGTNGQVLTSDGQGGQSWQTPTVPSVPVQDVKVNDVSVLDQGVANVPMASSSTLGVVKPGNGLGIDRSNGSMYFNFTTDAEVKAGTNGSKCAAVSKQHIAIFYGLAKVAGVDESGSSLALGTYSENAKSAISNMLNAPVIVSGTTPSITGKAGIRYFCGEVATLSITPPASGDCEIIFISGSTATVLTLPNTVKFPEWFDVTALEANRTYDIIITNATYGVVTSWES